MPDPAYIRHVTVNTGHRRDSRREEVSGPALDMCREIVRRLKRDGGTSMPHPPGYAVVAIAGGLTRSEDVFADMIRRVQAADDPVLKGGLVGRCLTAVVYLDRPKPVPVAIVAVAQRPRCGADVWANLLAHAARLGMASPADRPQPPAPWCAALLLPGIVGTDAPEWLGDFERCLAWAWVIEVGGEPATAVYDELDDHATMPHGPPRPVKEE